MELTLSVIRTLALSRSFLDLERYPDAQVCRGTQSANTCVRTPLKPKFNIPDRPSKLDPYADKLSQMLRAGVREVPQAEADDQAIAR